MGMGIVIEMEGIGTKICSCTSLPQVDVLSSSKRAYYGLSSHIPQLEVLSSSIGGALNLILTEILTLNHNSDTYPNSNPNSNPNYAMSVSYSLRTFEPLDC